MHLTYDFRDQNGNAMTPDPVTQASAITAVAEWNSFKGTTGVQIDPSPAMSGSYTPSTLQGAIHFQITSDNSTAGPAGGCASAEVPAQTIHYNSTFQLAASNHPSIGAFILAHEIGHILGLNDVGTNNPGYSTIMNNPVPAQLPAACLNPNVPTTTVQQGDATKMSACPNGAKMYQRQQLRSIQTDSTPVVTSSVSSSNSYPNCSYTYATVYFYVDGELDSAALYPVSVFCH